MSDHDDARPAVMPLIPRVTVPDDDVPGPGFPGVPSLPGGGQDDGGEGVVPQLPRLAAMNAPVDLEMPSLPELERDDASEGAFTGPAPENPGEPGARHVVGTAMALATALGVAAANGMWHRARQRKALADTARARADKAAVQAAKTTGGTTTSKTTTSKTTGSSGGSGAGAGRRGSSGGSGGAKGGGSSGSGRGGGSSAGRGGGGIGGGRGAKGAAGAKGGDGKSAKGADGKGAKGADGKGGGAKGTKDTKTTDPKKTADAKPDAKGGDAKGTKGADGKDAKTTDPKKTADAKPGAKGGDAKPSDGKGGTAPKDAGTGDSKATPEADQATSKPTMPARPEGPTGPSTAGTETTTPAPRPAEPTPGPAAAGAAPGPTPRPTPEPADSTAPRVPPLPDPGAVPDRAADRASASGPSGRPVPEHPVPGPEWEPPGFVPMRPPPRMDEPMRATAEVIRPDETEVHDAEVVDADWETVPTSSPRSGSTRPVLPAGGPTSSDAGSRAGSRKGEATVTVTQMPSGGPDTQYRDAELTVFDVIEADADMAEQITAGVDEAAGAADGCDRLYRKLEELHAKVVELRVPGVLEGMVLGLMDKTGHVKAKAEAIAQKLPAASEAIATAGVNAETRHRPLADAVRDAGHVRPAERDYHNE